MARAPPHYSTLCNQQYSFYQLLYPAGSMLPYSSISAVRQLVTDGQLSQAVRALQNLDIREIDTKTGVLIACHLTNCLIIDTFQIAVDSTEQRLKLVFESPLPQFPSSSPSLRHINMEALINTLLFIDTLIERFQLRHQNDANRVQLLIYRTLVATTVLKCICAIAKAAASNTHIDTEDTSYLFSTMLALSANSLQSILSLISVRHATSASPPPCSPASSALISTFNTTVKTLNTLAARLSSLASSPLLVLLRLRLAGAWLHTVSAMLPTATSTTTTSDSNTGGNTTDSTTAASTPTPVTTVSATRNVGATDVIREECTGDREDVATSYTISASFLSLLSLILRCDVLDGICKDVSILGTLRGKLVATTHGDNMYNSANTNDNLSSLSSPLDPFCEADNNLFVSHLHTHNHAAIAAFTVVGNNITLGISQLLRGLTHTPILFSLAVSSSGTDADTEPAKNTQNVSIAKEKATLPPLTLTQTPYMTPTISAKLSSSSLFVQLASALAHSITFSAQTSSLLPSLSATSTSTSTSGSPAVDIMPLLAPSTAHLFPLHSLSPSASNATAAAATLALHVLTLMIASNTHADASTTTNTNTIPSSSCSCLHLPPLAIPSPPMSTALRARVCVPSVAAMLAPDTHVTALLRQYTSTNTNISTTSTTASTIAFGDLPSLLARALVHAAMITHIHITVETVQKLFLRHKANILTTFQGLGVSSREASEFMRFPDFLSFFSRSSLETVLWLLWQGCVSAPHIWAPVLCGMGNMNILGTGISNTSTGAGVSVPLKALLSSVIAQATRAYTQLHSCEVPSSCDWTVLDCSAGSASGASVGVDADGNECEATSTSASTLLSPVFGPDLLLMAAEGWGDVSKVLCMCLVQEMEYENDDNSNKDNDNCNKGEDNAVVGTAMLEHVEEEKVDAEGEERQDCPQRTVEEEKKDEDVSVDVGAGTHTTTTTTFSSSSIVRALPRKLPPPPPRPLQPLLSVLRGVAVDACLPRIAVCKQSNGAEEKNSEEYEVSCSWLENLTSEDQDPEKDLFPENLPSKLRRMFRTQSFLCRLAQTHAPAAAALLLLKSPIYGVNISDPTTACTSTSAPARAAACSSPLSLSLVWSSVALLSSYVDTLAIHAHTQTQTRTEVQTRAKMQTHTLSLSDLAPNLTKVVSTSISLLSLLSSVSVVRNAIVQSGLHTAIALFLTQEKSLSGILLSELSGDEILEKDMVVYAQDLPLRVILQESGKTSQLPEFLVSVFPMIFLETRIYCISALSTLCASQLSLLTRTEELECVRTISTVLFDIVTRAVEAVRIGIWSNNVCKGLVGLCRTVIEAALYLTSTPSTHNTILTSTLIHALVTVCGMKPTAVTPPPSGKKIDFRNLTEIPVSRCLLLSEAILRDNACRYGLLRIWFNVLVDEEDVKREENVDASITGLKQAASKGLHNPLSSTPPSTASNPTDGSSPAPPRYALQCWCIFSGALRGVAAVRNAYKRETVHSITDDKARSVVLAAVFKENSLYSRASVEAGGGVNDACATGAQDTGAIGEAGSEGWCMPGLSITAPLLYTTHNHATSTSTTTTYTISDPTIGTKYSNNILVPLQHASSLSHIYTSLSHVNAKAGWAGVLSVPVAHSAYPRVTLPSLPASTSISTSISTSTSASAVPLFLPSLPNSSLFSTTALPTSPASPSPTSALPHTHLFILAALPTLLPLLTDTLSETKVLAEEVERRTTKGEGVEGTKEPYIRGSVRPQMYYNPGLITSAQSQPQAPSLDTLASAATKLRDRAVASMARMCIYVEPTLFTTSSTSSTDMSTKLTKSTTIVTNARSLPSSASSSSCSPSALPLGLGLSADMVKKMGRAIIALLETTQSQAVMHECFMGLTSLVTHPDPTIAISLIVNEEENSKTTSQSPKLQSTLLNLICDTIYNTNVSLQIAALELLTNITQYTPIGMLLCGLRKENQEKSKNPNSGVPNMVVKSDIVRMLLLLLTDNGSNEDDTTSTSESISHDLRLKRQVVCGSVLAMLSDGCEYNAHVLAHTVVRNGKNAVGETDNLRNSGENNGISSGNAEISGMLLMRAICSQYQQQQQPSNRSRHAHSSSSSLSVSAEVYQRCMYALERMMQAERKVQSGGMLQDLWDTMG